MLLEFSKLVFSHWPTIYDGLFCPTVDSFVRANIQFNDD